MAGTSRMNREVHVRICGRLEVKFLRSTRRVSMSREKLKWKPHKSQSTDAGHRGGVTRSSVEGRVMGLERRGDTVRLYQWVN